MVDDLCAMAAEKPEEVRKLFANGGTLYGCSERALKALLDFAGVRSEVNVAATSPSPSKTTPPFGHPSAGGEFNDGDGDVAATPWPAWYPVIDRQRCTHCGKCVQFCLFSVYAKKDGKVTVVAPKNCKNNCPACARVCPANAIIFPKHPDVPINGEEGETRDQRPETSGGNLSDRLRRRRTTSILKQ